MTAQTVLNQFAVYFGGPYDAATRTYRTPQLPGLGVVRRAWAKDDVHADYLLNMQAGTESGSQMVVQLSDGESMRRALGVKRVHYHVELHVFIRSVAAYAEDVQDYGYALRDAIVARIEADRTCGSGGFEAGGFQVGEGEGDMWLRWEFGQSATNAQLTQAYLRIDTTAVEYIQA